MAQPSVRRPWVLEMKVAKLDQWFTVDAFRSEDTAEMNLALNRKRAPEAQWRIYDIRPRARYQIGGKRP